MNKHGNKNAEWFTSETKKPRKGEAFKIRLTNETLDI